MRIDIVPVGRLETNCCLLWDEASHIGCVVDPGDDVDAIYNRISELKMDVVAILLTHTHWDHVGAVKALWERLENKPTIYAHKVEYEQLMSNERHPEIDRSFKVDQYISDGYINVGSKTLKVLLLPGHTDASICFYDVEAGFVIAGDTLFYHSIGIVNYYNGPGTDLAKNIKSTLLTLPDETIIYPGHGRETTCGEEKLNNPYIK